MNTVQWRMTLILALVAGITAACETGTEPTDGPAFDAEAALADHQALDTLLASHAMDGFRAMAPQRSCSSWEANRGPGRLQLGSRSWRQGWTESLPGTPSSPRSAGGRRSSTIPPWGAT